MRLTLAIDTTMNGCSVGLYDSAKDKIVAEESQEMPRGQAEHLMPMIERVMKETDKTYDQLDAIAVTRGPGAFTGMRIGLATAKSLGMVLNIPVIGVSTFEAVLKTSQASGLCGVLLETKRQDYYFQLFENAEPIGAQMVGLPADILTQIGDRECTLIGDAIERFKSEINLPETIKEENIVLPAPLAIARIAANTAEEAYSSDPVYIRGPEIGQPKNPPRKLKSSSV